MEESDQKSKGFKVEDRRRFSAEGEPRPEAESKPQAAAAGVEPPSPAGAAAAAHEPREEAAAGPELSFSTFIVGLSTEALAALGEIPHPATGEHKRDLRAAQELIDIIGILRDKTHGNLDHDEESLLEAILFDLRMKYVELVRQSKR